MTSLHAPDGNSARAFAASQLPRRANNSLPHLGGADSQGSFWKNTPALSLPSFSPSLLGSCQFPHWPSSDPQAHVECLLGSLGAPLPTPTSPGFPRSPLTSPPGVSGTPCASDQVPHPASPRGEALFRCARPSGVPRGPATSTGSLASQRHPGKFPKVPGRRRARILSHV